MKISACMIVKDEERFIKGCLESIKGFVDEIVVGIDSRTTDKTREIVREYTDKIIDIEWTSNFSSARNEVLRKARGDWIIIIDADEVMSESDGRKLREILGAGEADAYYSIWRDYSNDEGIREWQSSKGDTYEESSAARGFTQTKILRIFRNNPSYHFQGRIHETPTESIKNNGGRFLETDIVIHHYGNLRSKKEIDEKKALYSRMLMEELDSAKTSKERYYVLFELARELIIGDQSERAEKYLEESIALNPDYAPALSMLGGVYLYHGDLERAEMMLKKSLMIEGNDDSAHANLGIVYSKKGDNHKAIKKLQRAIEINDKSPDHFYNLGITYRLMGREDEAQKYFDRAVELNPDYKKKIWD